MPACSPIIDSTLIIHRGASAYAPENTLQSLALAADMGSSWVESDVRLTADDQLIMLHDDDVRRTTDGAGQAALLPLDAIGKLDAGGWFSPRYRGCSVPTLSQYLTMTQERQLGLVLELKHVHGWEEKLVRLVAAEITATWRDSPEKLVISAFSERCLKTAKILLPNHPRCLAVTAIPELPAQRLSDVNATMLHLQHSYAGPEGLARLREAEMEFAFATVNNPQRARHLLKNGATSIMTDKPDLLDKGAGHV
ncbi:MAG: glycerophosphodiester phosphodiesterase family protein [Rhizobiaceae bacterium]